MVQHPTYIVGFEQSLDEFVKAFFESPLADQIDFFDNGIVDFKQQGDHNFNEDRPKLASTLYSTKDTILESTDLLKKLNEYSITYRSGKIKDIPVIDIVFNVNNMRYDCVSKTYDLIRKGYIKQGDLALFNNQQFEAGKFYRVADSLVKLVKRIDVASKHSKIPKFLN